MFGMEQLLVSSQEGRQTVRGGREDVCQHPASKLCLDEPLKGRNSLSPLSVYSKHTQEYTQWDLRKTKQETPGEIQMDREHMYTQTYCTCQGKQVFATGHLSQVDVILGAFGSLQLYF